MLAVVTKAALLASGFTEDAIRAQIDGGRWRQLTESAICLHNGPLTVPEQRLAAVLTAPWPVALCGVTGLSEWGVTGFEVSAVHMVVTRGTRVLPLPGVDVVVHESRRFSGEDVVVRAGRPPVTRLERSTVDAAAWSVSPLLASRLLVAPVQQRLCPPSRLVAELALAGQIRHGRLLRRLAADLDGGAQALSEVEFVRWCRRHGLPRPELQVRLDRRGRRRYLDARFRHNGRVVLVEIDGGVHLSLASRWEDTAKDNDAVLDGLTSLRFPSVAIYRDDPRALEQLRRALGLVMR